MNDTDCQDIYFRIDEVKIDVNRCGSSVRMWVQPDSVPWVGGRRAAAWLVELDMVSQFDPEAPILTITKGAIEAAKEFLMTDQPPPQYKGSRKIQGDSSGWPMRWFKQLKKRIEWHDPDIYKPPT